MQETRPTLKEVALKSGFALRTVKKVMGGSENVRDETRDRVLAAASELNYQRNNFASALAKGKNTRIAIVYSATTVTYFQEVERGFRRCAEELRDFGVSAEFFKLNDREAKSQIAVLKELIENEEIGGLIIQPISRSKLDSYIDELVDKGKPVITFGADATSEKRLCYIGPNAYTSGRVGAQILANYIGKRGNVVVISDNGEHMQTVDRVKGFTDRVNEYYPNLRITHLHIPDNPGLYYQMIRTLVTNEKIEGIFCTDSNSYIAGEVLRDLDIKDIVVVGFDISKMAVDFMKQGYLKVIIEQNPEDFSYNAMKAMFNHLYYGEIPEKIQYTGISILIGECV